MSAAESIVCWRWRPFNGYRSTFEPDTVNTLRRMVARHYARPHRFICVTDDPAGIDPAVEVVPLWTDFEQVQNPFGRKFPSCYRRLRAFHPDIASVFGRRFVSLDLDTVITGDVTPLWDRPEDFVCWGNTHSTTPYNGSMFLLTAGARAQVWTRFNPQRSPSEAQHAGFFGSDQGWMSYVLGPGEARWSTHDGVYSFRLDVRRRYALPADARIVMFHGTYDPWHPQVKALGWVKQHYQ